MKPAFLKQLVYMAERRSWVTISHETGIPTTALRMIRQGKVEPSPAFLTDIRNAYRRESYARLRDIGYSSHQARRWSTYGTETVRNKAVLLEFKIAELSIGAVAARLKSEGLATTPQNVDRYYTNMYRDILEGIKHSPLKTEEIMDY